MSSYPSRQTSLFNIFIRHGSPKALAQLNALTCETMRSSAWRPRLASTPLGTRRSASTSRSLTALISIRACRTARCGTTRTDAMACFATSITSANQAAAVLSFHLHTTDACPCWVTTVQDGIQPENITRRLLTRMRKWALMNSTYRSSPNQRRKIRILKRRRAPPLNCARRGASRTCAMRKCVPTMATAEVVAARKS